MPSQGSLLPQRPADEHVAAVIGSETAVQFFYLAGDELTLSRIEGRGFYINDVLHVVDGAVAQRAAGIDDAPLVRNEAEVFVDGVLAVYDGAYLEQEEVGGAVLDVHGKFYLDGTAHFFCPDG